MKRVSRSLVLTYLGLVAERFLQAFWPMFSTIFVILAALMFGWQGAVPANVVWLSAVVSILLLMLTFGVGLRKIRWPTRMQALVRVDELCPDRPIQALMDTQILGIDDPESAAVWRAHQERMKAKMADIKPVCPDLRLSSRDPYALRYVALVAMASALIFGSIWRIGTVTELTPGQAFARTGPTWEGWVEPPRYTGFPTIYLNDFVEETLRVPQGTGITLRLYDDVGVLHVNESLSDRMSNVSQVSGSAHQFNVTQSGELSIEGPGGQSWTIEMIKDAPPRVEVAGPVTTGTFGEMKLPFRAWDDYGVERGEVIISLDLESVPRLHGLRVAPEPREPIALSLPMPITGDRSDFQEEFAEDFSQHPWANLPVEVSLSVTDVLDNKSSDARHDMYLVARRFFDPLAASIAEQRRDLLWSRDNAHRVAQVLRALSYRPEDVFDSETLYLRLRVTLRRLEVHTELGLRRDVQEEIAASLWDIAVHIEEGDLSDVLERMRQIQERLSEAIRNGASDQEIADLMQELRQATQDYLRQLSRQALQNQNGTSNEFGRAPSDSSMFITDSDLERMMDRIQELMQQGRMAEAQQALQEFQKMMENMRIAQGQGTNGSSPGQQVMEGLAETLRQQQELSDQAFRDLQRQFDSGSGAERRQEGQGSRDGDASDELRHGSQGSGQDGGPNGRSGLEQDLANRQNMLRNRLQQHEMDMPGTGTTESQDVQDAIDRAGRAMEGAEEALRSDELAEAIDQQSEAMEALREAMRSLNQMLANQQGQSGQGTEGADLWAPNRDPLGRNAGSTASIGTDDTLLQNEEVDRRSYELLNEIRRLSGEGERPEMERDYLKRLLEKF